jgi:PKD repeat protein
MKRAFTLISLCLLMHLLHASTFTVTTTNDAGAGSLREAMTFCNLTPGADIVAFNIAGQAPHTISVLSSLPILNDPGTTIDGTTQPPNGYTGTGRKIVIDGVNMSGGNGIEVNGANFTLRGVRIQKFPYNGLVINATASGYTIGGIGMGNTISQNFYSGFEVNGAPNGVIKGNFIGTNDDGTAANPNEYEGLSLYAGANGTVIGGVLTGEGNVISGNRYYGLQLDGVSNCTILGNMIGVDATGTVAVPNEYYGILLTNGASNNTLGSAAAGGGNVISGNLYHGIAIECSNTTTSLGNKIGTDVSGGSAIPNEYSGIDIGPTSSNFTCSASGNVIGGLGQGEGNIIGNNLYYGVNIWGANADFNPVRGNKIFCNDYDGFTLVDGNTGQPNGNDGYPSPVITSANAAGAAGTAGANDHVDIYFDDQCTNCEPRSLVASVQANGSGNWTYSGALSGSITAIATSSTNNNSSANSPCSFVSGSTLPIANFSATATDFCGSGCTNFLDFSTGQPTAWAWSFPGATPATSTLQNPQNICYNAPGTYDVTLTVTNGSGSDAQVLVGYITVDAIPSVNAGPDLTLCEGDTVPLQGNSNGGYAWTPATSLSNASIASPLAFPTTTTTYVLSGQLGNCSAADTTVVTVFPITQPTISQVGYLLTATSGASFQWYLNGAPIPGATAQSYLATASGTYSVVVIDANGCSGESAGLLVDVVGVDPAAAALGMALVPNPSDARCTVQLTGLDLQPLTLQVIDVLGRVVTIQSFVPAAASADLVVDVATLPDGCYHVVLAQGDHRAVQVLVVRK